MSRKRRRRWDSLFFLAKVDETADFFADAAGAALPATLRGSQGQGVSRRGLKQAAKKYAPLMPRDYAQETERHRVKNPRSTFGIPACVARPVSRKEMMAAPKAVAAMRSEWDRLWKKKVWSHDKPIEWSQVAKDARVQSKKVHLGRIFGIRVEKGSELPENDARRKFKYRLVFAGNAVPDENWQSATFQDLGSSLASQEAGKACDAYGCFPGHEVQQADAEQAYVQAKLTGTETWIAIPEEGWPDSWFHDGSGRSQPKYKTPCVRLHYALYGHPDSGTFWEKHCDRALRQQGFGPVTTWQSCYYHRKLRLFLTMYMDDFKMSGPS